MLFFVGEKSHAIKIHAWMLEKKIMILADGFFVGLASLIKHQFSPLKIGRLDAPKGNEKVFQVYPFSGAFAVSFREGNICNGCISKKKNF